MNILVYTILGLITGYRLYGAVDTLFESSDKREEEMWEMYSYDRCAGFPVVNNESLEGFWDWLENQ